MRRETYHLVATHEPGHGEATEEWAQACLANARAAFLQQLGLTSARLRAQGLRLGLRPDTQPLPEIPPLEHGLGITLILGTRGNGFTINERLYDVGELWQPFWHGQSRVWAEADGQARPLPADMARELEAWLHLSRGSVPVPDDRHADCACG